MAGVTVTAEQLLAALERDWPQECEISTLRLVTAAQDRRIAELEAMLVELKPATAEGAAAGEDTPEQLGG